MLALAHYSRMLQYFLDTKNSSILCSSVMEAETLTENLQTLLCLDSADKGNSLTAYVMNVMPVDSEDEKSSFGLICKT